VSTYFADITIINNPKDTLTFVPSESTGVHENEWPTRLAPGKTYGPFQQGFNFQIKFNAAFANMAAPDPTPTIWLYMYGDGVQVFSTHITQSPNNPAPYPGSISTHRNPRSATFTIEN
jgi:hypothetical protein